ncbi:MAG: hypothetical protein ACYCYP_01405 [Leptospirales bacterium]
MNNSRFLILPDVVVPDRPVSRQQRKCGETQIGQDHTNLLLPV